MSIIYRFVKGITSAIPVILAKLGAVMLFFIGLGMLLGYYFGTGETHWWVLFIPFVAMAVMWRDLDEGVLVLLLLILVAFFVPDLFVFLN